MLIGAKADAFHRRPGRQAFKKALDADRFDVLIVFATSRMERNDYRLKQFVQEEIVERLNTSRNCITESIRIWRQRRGLPVPDGRTLRKERNQRMRST